MEALERVKRQEAEGPGRLKRLMAYRQTRMAKPFFTSTIGT